MYCHRIHHTATGRPLLPAQRCTALQQRTICVAPSARLRTGRPCRRGPCVVKAFIRPPLDSLEDTGRQHARSTHDDEIKEKSRVFRRTVFTHEMWEAHRSTSRYNRHLFGMFSSRMVRGLSRPLSYVVGLSSAVVIYESLRQAGMLPDVLPVRWPSIQINHEPFGLTNFAMALLLVFRTNSSYARWLDARKTWGLLLNRSRDFVRQGLTYFPDDKMELKDMLCRWTPAFSKTLMCHLRKDNDLGEELRGVLLPEEVQQVLLAQHRPSFVLQVLSEVVKKAGVDGAIKMRMDENITSFEDDLGTCERILKTPIPLSYTRHTSRFLIIWLTLLPFSIVGVSGWTTVPHCVLIAFLLLGIEEIGVSIEEPFSILALENICESALTNIRELQYRYATPQGTSIAANGAAQGIPQLSALQMVDKFGSGGGVGLGGSSGGGVQQGVRGYLGSVEEDSGLPGGVVYHVEGITVSNGTQASNGVAKR